MEEKGIFQQEGYDVMGAAFEVYNQMGWGLTEEVYQECLGIPKNWNGNDFYFGRIRDTSDLLKRLKFQPFNLYMALSAV